ncbi:MULTISPECIES: GAF domain-containing protein [unclassified Methylobacterium]|uniref:GAF domain-containing protein n=1 Tax=unclassified Methylobacterium TaxID=2615210 RepID=UPI003701BC47
MSATVTAFPAWSRRSTEAREDGRADLDLLHGICVDLIGEQDLGALCGKIVDAAVRITGSQFGTMQRLCPPDHPSHPGHLEMLYARGLTPEAEAGWHWVHPASVTSCTAALKRGQRAVVPDFEAWDDIIGTDDLLAFRRSGIRSAQTTPLMSRSGRLLGMSPLTGAHRTSRRNEIFGCSTSWRGKPPTSSNGRWRKTLCAGARSVFGCPRLGCGS